MLPGLFGGGADSNIVPVLVWVGLSPHMLQMGRSGAVLCARLVNPPRPLGCHAAELSPPVVLYLQCGCMRRHASGGACVGSSALDRLSEVWLGPGC